MKPFTALTAKTIKREGFHRDRGDGAARGLYLQVRGSRDGVARSWLFRFKSPTVGKLRWMGLGPTEVISLGEARDAARGARKLVLEGIDPIEKRRDDAQAIRVTALRDQASRMTFRQCADAYAATHLASFKSDTHRRSWRRSLEGANKAFGDLPVGQIDTDMIVKFLEPRWRETPVTASRTRGRIESILDWATVHKFRQGDNPARWKGHLKHVFAALPDAEHHAAMPHEDIPDFLNKLRASGLSGAAMLEFLILTVTRKGEALNARWEEIDLDKRLWTIPAERMKTEVKHEIPLSYRAVEILVALPRVCPFVFTSSRGKHLSNGATLACMTLAGGATIHGFRSSFRDWAGDKTHFEREVVEHALAHKLPDRVEAAYRRGTTLQKRRVLMQAWCDFCMTGETKVVPMSQTA